MKKIVVVTALVSSLLTTSVVYGLDKYDKTPPISPTPKEGAVILNKDFINGITPRMADARSNLTNEQYRKLNQLLIHSRDLIDVYMFGLSQSATYVINGDELKTLLKADLTQLEELLADDYAKIDKLIEVSNGKRFKYEKINGKVRPTTNPLTNDYLAIVWGIRDAYQQAINGVGTREPMLDHTAVTGIELEIGRARLETYRQYLSNSEIVLEDVLRMNN